MFIPDPNLQNKQIAMKLEDDLKHSGNDPEIPPPKEPGDGFVILGAVIGFIIGGIIGAFINSFLHYILFFLILAGVFVGSLIGTFSGSRLKKHMLRRNSKDIRHDPKYYS